MATPPFWAPEDKIIIAIAGAQLHYKGQQTGSIKKSLW